MKGIFLLLLWLSACDDGRATLAVSLLGSLDGVQRIEVSLAFDGQSKVQPLNEDTARFDVKLPAGLTGKTRIQVDAIGPNDCVLVSGNHTTNVIDSGRYAVDVQMARPDPPDCLIRAVLSGQGSGSVTQGRHECLHHGGDSTSCDVVAGRNGEDVELLAVPEAGSFFLGWSGACTGPGGCRLKAGRGMQVAQAGFVLRDICSSDGWCWQNPLPQGDQLIRIRGTASNDIWATTGSGTFLHWTGAFWLGVPGPATGTLSGIWGSAGDDVWAVGTQVLHWDGGTWKIVDDGTTLLDVSGTAPDDIWAVGKRGSIRHWQGSEWQDVDSPGKIPKPTLNGVSAIRKGEAWAVGNDGSLLHFHGGAWSMQALPAGYGAPSLCAVASSGPNDVWVVGISRSTLHFDGTRWTWLSQEHPSSDPHCLDSAGSGDNNLYDVWVAGGSVWATGDGASLLRWHWHTGNKSGEWEVVQTGGLSSVWGTGPNDVWGSGPAGILLHWNGFQVTASSAGAGGELRGVYRVGDDLWTVGDQGQALRFRGTAWEPIQTGVAANLGAVWGMDPTHVWAVGERGTVLRWDGQVWTRYPLDPKQYENIALDAVWGATSEDVWIGGYTVQDPSAAVLLRYQNGVITEVSPPAEMASIHGMWGSSATDVWAVGSDRSNRAAAYHLQGGVWSNSGVPPILNYLTGVTGIPGGEVWAVALNGVALHWTAGQWVAVTVEFDGDSPVLLPPLFAISAADRNHVWAVGQAGFIMQWDSRRSRWVHSPSGASGILLGVFAGKGGEAWVVGHISAILHRP